MTRSARYSSIGLSPVPSFCFPGFSHHGIPLKIGVDDFLFGVIRAVTAQNADFPDVEEEDHKFHLSQDISAIATHNHPNPGWEGKRPEKASEVKQIFPCETTLQLSRNRATFAGGNRLPGTKMAGISAVIWLLLSKLTFHRSLPSSWCSTLFTYSLDA